MSPLQGAKASRCTPEPPFDYPVDKRHQPFRSGHAWQQPCWKLRSNFPDAQHADQERADQLPSPVDCQPESMTACRLLHAAFLQVNHLQQEHELHHHARRDSVRSNLATQAEFFHQAIVMAKFPVQRSEHFSLQAETNHSRERNPVSIDDSVGLSSDTKEYSHANDAARQELILRRLERAVSEAGESQEMFPSVHSIQVAFPDHLRR